MNSTTSSTARARFDPFILLDIALNLWLAYRYFQLWVMPAHTDADRIFYMATLMAFEFIMVHSGVFMALMPFKISVLVFVPAYGLFALCFNTFVPDNSILYLYLVVVFSRMRFAFFNKSEEAKNQAIGFSIYAVAVYFFILMGVAIFSASIPQIGLTTAFLKSSGYNPSIGGLFTDQPETAMCAGLSYYVMISLYCVLAFYFSFKNWLKSRDTLSSPLSI